MNIKQRIIAAGVAASFGISLMATPAMASEDGRRNTAIGLGVAAAGLLLTQRNKAPGIIAGVAAIAAASQIDNDRHRWDRRYGYYDNGGYGYGYNHSDRDYRYDRDDRNRGHDWDDYRRNDRDNHRWNRDNDRDDHGRHRR